ncbi:MAG TPA: hypothetical protein VLH13_02520 [Methanomassiliicoccales archaeon]|nr:hypothetical protein [Methanomassiliicoccales archaeon]
MGKSNEDLAKEIKELREELKQMREMVGVLLSMVIEVEEDEDEMYALTGGLEVPHINN